MFGYLQIQKSELLVKEAETYKSVYCSLCKTIGRDFSFLCRCLLSYDYTFYTLLSMAVAPECAGFAKGRCCCNPLKSCVYCADSDALHSAAALTIIAAYHKLSDDVSDSRGVKRLASRLLRFWTAGKRKRASASYPQLDSALDNMMTCQKALEDSGESVIDACCEPTGIMLGRVFSFLSSDETQKKILYEMGYHLGKWIYLMDAADDIDNDIKNHNFNCLIPLFQTFDNRKDFADECAGIMNLCIANAYAAFNLLNINRLEGILNNHFVFGMPEMQKKILYKTAPQGSGA